MNLLAVSYNQPKLCANASWDPNATTFAGSNLIGPEPRGFFIDRNNTVYIPDKNTNRILVLAEGTSTPIANISANLSDPITLFVTTTGDIYVDAFNSIGGINKCNLNSAGSTPIMYTCGRCFDLFVDINDTLYCVLKDAHKIISKSLKKHSNAWTIVAGTNTNGSASNMLNEPRGIFVDINLNLYVADRSNHRIQLFRPGETNGTTVAGNTSPNITITLNQPSAVILDAENYLFITDSKNNRIVGSGPNGFQCLVGCNGSGLQFHQLNYPISLRFDNHGNIFVSDFSNNRTQKFLLLSNSCSKLNNKSSNQ